MYAMSCYIISMLPLLHQRFTDLIVSPFVTVWDILGDKNVQDKIKITFRQNSFCVIT